MLQVSVTKMVNGKELFRYTGEGSTTIEAIKDLPDQFLENVYRKANEYITGFEDSEFPLDGEEEERYETALENALEKGFDSYCDSDGYAMKWEEMSGV